jgi:hypothetical protein
MPGGILSVFNGAVRYLEVAMERGCLKIANARANRHLQKLAMRFEIKIHRFICFARAFLEILFPKNAPRHSCYRVFFLPKILTKELRTTAFAFAFV